ncbi:unnamed protein product [Colias eurytheme]|nr:unnamed protein product [Colias eurytheme]
MWKAIIQKRRKYTDVDISCEDTYAALASMQGGTAATLPPSLDALRACRCTPAVLRILGEIAYRIPMLVANGICRDAAGGSKSRIADAATSCCPHLGYLLNNALLLFPCTSRDYNGDLLTLFCSKKHKKPHIKSFITALEPRMSVVFKFLSMFLKLK